jgi:hypothetical protein
LFFKNAAYGSATMGSDGGAIDAWCPSTIINSTFVGNVSAGGWSGWAGAVSLGILGFEQDTIRNSIFWKNYATSFGGELVVGTINNVYILACDIEGGVNGPKVRDYSNLIQNGGLNINSNPIFANSIQFSDATTANGTTTTVKVKDAGIYAVNDVIEYDGDGIGRKITAIDTNTDTLTFANNALGSNSLAYRGILNWGQNATDLTIDLQLNSNSPCIDAGFNASIALDFDLAGNPRKVDGNNDQAVYVDMGCYEYQP